MASLTIFFDLYSPSYIKADHHTSIYTFLIFFSCRSAFLAAAPTVMSLSPPQVPMNTLELPALRLFASDYFQGDDVQQVLRSIASGLN